MDLFSIILIVVGLSLFEIINSIDNAVINAEVLGNVSAKAKKWFLFWGLLVAVFLVRGLLPWLIIWSTTPQLGFIRSFTATFSSDPTVSHAIESSAPILLSGAGIFLIFLFLHWLFLEPKAYGLHTERFFEKQGVWFYTIASILLLVFVWFGLQKNTLMAFSLVVGSTVFFFIHGLRQNAEKVEHALLHKESGFPDWNKIIYLEVIDASFSIDGVLGAFAFTFSIPLIILGNGIGAFVVRQLTVGNIDIVKKYKYLKNGAMYSILALGIVMLTNAFGVHTPEWISPVITIAILAFFFWKSKREL